MTCLFPFSSAQNSFFFFEKVSSLMKLPVDSKITGFLNDSPFKKPSIDNILAALEWRRKLYFVGFADIDAFPGHEGEILVSGIKDDLTLEVTVEVDLSLSVALDEGERQVFMHERLSENQAREKLFEAARFLWISSGGFIWFTSTSEKNASKAWPSKTHPGPMEACP